MQQRPPAMRGRNILAVILAAVGAGVVVTPPAGFTSPNQEDPGSGSMVASGQTAVVEVDVDVAEADTSTVVGTLEEIQGNVTNQLAQLQVAQNAVTAAQAELDGANAAVAATEAEIVTLSQQSDAVVVEAFMLPPAAGVVETFDADDAGDATVKQALIGMQADEDASVLEQLAAAQDQLEDRKEEQRAAAAEADGRRSDAEAALGDLHAATSQQAEFLGMVNARLEQGLTEVATLAAIDPAMSAQLAQSQAALAAKIQEITSAQEYQRALAALAEAERQAAEAAAAAPPPPIQLGSASGSLSSASCPGGGSITVDSTLAGQLQSMLNAAHADGVDLCGTGYRSPDDQIAVRRANCGSSYYAIYEAPASSCSPPTARPGTSMHEQGLAIDFTCNGGGVISSGSSPCFQWLDANAAGYGLYNLPSERWHWSTNGN